MVDDRLEVNLVDGRLWMVDGRSVLCTKSQIRPCAKVFSIPQKFFHFVRIQHADIADICQILQICILWSRCQLF